MIEPLFLEQLLARLAAAAPERTWLHRVLLLLLSWLIVADAVADSQGIILLAG